MLHVREKSPYTNGMGSILDIVFKRYKNHIRGVSYPSIGCVAFQIFTLYEMLDSLLNYLFKRVGNT